MKICPQCSTPYEAGEQFCPLDGARLSSDSEVPSDASMIDPLVGQVLADRYKVRRVIGAGGMGVVYEAEHTVIGKHVAVKVLRGEVSEKPDVLERFKQEAKSASKIGHENIIDISDFGETPEGAAFLVMEMLEGYDLANVLQEQGTLPTERAIPILVQCCKALGAAHDKGIIHRDMKPENVFLVNREDRADFVKIVDFGIAKMSDLETPGAPGRKLTKTGMIFGTPEYMSPEQAYGRPTDHRVDIYAMGIIAYEIFAGRVPFIGESFMGILSQHMLEMPAPIREYNPHSTIPAAVEHVIYRCLEKDPNARPQTMRDLANELLAAIGASGLIMLPEASPTGFPPAKLSSAPGAQSMVPTPSRFGRTPTPGSASGIPGSVPGSSGSVPAVRHPGNVPRSHAPSGTAMLSGDSIPALRPPSSIPIELERPRSRVAPILLGLLFVVGVGAAIAYFVMNPTEPVVASSDAGVAIAHPPTQVDAGGGEAPPSVIDAGAGTGTEPPVEEVTVFVYSDPRRAEVRIGDRLVCASTPCSVRTPRGQEVVFQLQRGQLTGTATITPVADSETIDVRLRAPGTGIDPDQQNTMMGDMEPFMVMDLMWPMELLTPREFQ